MVVQQFGGSVLEGLGQSSQQHGELRSVKFKQGDQHHLGRLQKSQQDRLGRGTQQSNDSNDEYKVKLVSLVPEVF